MSNSFEEISRYTANSGGRPDSNLANDANHLGGIAAEDYATKSWVQRYHERMENALRIYIDTQDSSVLEQAKRYADSVVASQNFSQFAKLSDVQTLSQNLNSKIEASRVAQKTYTDAQILKVVSDSNVNFTKLEDSIKNTNKNVSTLNTSLNNSVKNINDSITNINEDIDDLNDNVQNLFQSVSSGKSLVAEAITDKGVATSAKDSFSTMANNVRKIKTGTDTSDATATANDILKGKTAYVNGKKIYGNFVYSGNSGNNFNPNNPYPATGQVELVYSESEESPQVNVGFNCDVAADLVTVTGDGQVAIIYNKTTKQLETYYRMSDGSFGKVQNQYGEVKTPNYSLTDLGIEENIVNNYSVSKIACSRMNTDSNDSGYYCKLAIFMIQNQSNNENGAGRVYIFTLSTSLLGGSSIGIVSNENYTAGVEGSTSQGTKYRKWVVVYSKGTTSPSFGNWSPFTDRLAMVFSGSIYIYEFDSYIADTNGNSGYGHYTTVSTISSGTSPEFLNEDRIVKFRKRVSSSTYTFFAIYSENFIKIGEAQPPSGVTEMITPDAQYIISHYNIKRLIVDYVNATITLGDTVWEGESGSISFNTTGNYFFFSLTGKYLFVKSSAGSNPTHYYIRCYQIDYENGTVTLLYTQEVNASLAISQMMAIPGLRGVVFGSAYVSPTFTYSLFEVQFDREKLVGLKYNGDMFYKDFFSAGKLSALAIDVKSGKTFVGNMGVVETGSLEVEA